MCEARDHLRGIGTGDPTKHCRHEGARVVFLFVLLGTPGAFSLIAPSPLSFYCNNARNATEKRICADAGLAQLDWRLTATLYRDMRGFFRDKDEIAQIRTERRNWIAQRNKCGEDSKCIARRY
jgi:uncharacterized protein